MHALLITETTPKLMKLSAFARTTVRDNHWKVVTTGAFTVADADIVYLATDPTPRGDLLAVDVAEQILARYPERQLQRLRVNEMTESAFAAGMQETTPLNGANASSLRVGRILNHLVSTRVQALTGRPSGRAVLPLLSRIAELERPGGRIVVMLTSGVRFESATIEKPAAVFDQIGAEVPRFTIENQQLTLPSPRPYRTATLQRDGCRILGARAIEVASQTEQLYHGGYIAQDRALDEPYVEAGRRELVTFGDVPGERVPGGRFIVPVDLQLLPSDVPRPIRPVYRLIWANTLCSLARSMPVRIERAAFVLGGARFTAESVVPLEQGFDHASFGLFYRRGCIGKSQTVDTRRAFGPGPFEHELLDDIGDLLPYKNPALVLKAAENLGYIGFDGQEVVILDYGRTVLETVETNVPQLLDGQCFASTERYLEASEHDPSELIEPWSRWADCVSRAVKKRGVAYLR